MPLPGTIEAAIEKDKKVFRRDQQVSHVRPDDKIVLATVGDLHLTLDPPAFRSREKDWLGVQAGYLTQVRKLLEKYRCSLVCTGDIFDDGWREKKCPPELINFAINHLPMCYGVAGNHDLPHHRYDQIQRSAYWTLVQAGRVIHLTEKGREMKGWTGLKVYGFSWGQEITPPLTKSSDLYVAVCHAYCWKDGHCFPGVTPETHVSHWEQQINNLGYSVGVFGDNHKGFVHKNILNGGGFMCRRSDERDYMPFVGLLTSKGEWRRHYLDVTGDVYLDAVSKEPPATNDYSAFLKMLEELGDTALDFESSVTEIFERHRTPQPVREIVLRCMGRQQS